MTRDTSQLMDEQSFAITVRFPFGSEYWQSDTLPEIGSTMTRGGREYVVASCEQQPDRAYALRMVERSAEEGIEPVFA